MALVLVGGLASVSARHKSELSIRMLVTKHKASRDLQHQTVSLVESIPWSGMVIGGQFGSGPRAAIDVLLAAPREKVSVLCAHHSP